MNERDIFDAALDIADSKERAAWLDQACGGNALLRQQIDDLLAAQSKLGSFLNQPPQNLQGTRDYEPVTEKPGSIIGPYKLKEQIGEGGFGLVFVAEQTEPVRRKVALKLIKPGMDSKQVIARFEAERQALAMMDHINIAKVLDAGTTESGRPYFVMELVHGVPITKYCDSYKLTLRERVELFVPVCQAIQHAHQKGIIHRDIKPSNVLVTLYDDKPVPKVIDFGVAKAIEQRLTEKSIYTQFGALVGTLEYVSPEQAEMNAFGVDTRSDIYSLGVLLYELLTGTTPLERSRLRETAFAKIVEMIKEEEAPRPSVRLSGSETLDSVAEARRVEPTKLSSMVRGELDWIVMKCLEKDRTRRYDGASGLAKDVQRYLTGDAVEACPPTLGYRLRKTYRRYRSAILTVGLCATVLLIATGVSLAFGILAKQAERRALVQKEIAADSVKETRRANQALLDEQNRLIEVNYAKSTQMAEMAWRDNNLGTALRLLEDAPEHLRGWEWHYLHRLCNTGYLRSLEGHTNNVMSASYSPDGKWIFTYSADRTAKLWSVETGEVVHTFRGHKTFVWSAELTPDGRQILTVGSDQVIKLWDVKTGEEIWSIELKEYVYRAKLSPDGKLLFTYEWSSYLLDPDLATKELQAKVWSATTGRFIRDFTLPGTVVRTCLSPDGRQIVTAHSNGTVGMWDVGDETVKKLDTLEGHTGYVLSISFSPDDKKILSTSDDKTAILWDRATRSPIRKFEGHTERVSGARFSPDGTRIVTYSLDRTVRVWDVESGQCKWTLEGHTGSARATFSPNGKQIVSAGHDGLVMLWNAENGQHIQTLQGHVGRINSVCFSPDGKRILTSGQDKTAKVWDVRASPHPKVLLQPEKGEAIYKFCFSADGSRVVTVSRKTSLSPSIFRLLDASTQKIIVELKPEVKPDPTSLRSDVALSPDGKWILTTNYSTAKLWDTSTGKLLYVLKEHADRLFSASFSPDGTQILTASQDNTAKVWDSRTGKVIRTLEGHDGPVKCATFSPDGTRIVTTSTDKTARLWDAQTGKVIRTLQGHTSAIWSGAFSPDGTRIVTASLDNTARLWDTKTGKLLRVLKGHADWLRSASFSPDGTRIVTASEDSTVKLWDANTGHELITLRYSAGVITRAKFSWDGKQIIATSRDGNIVKWDGTPFEKESSR